MPFSAAPCSHFLCGKQDLVTLTTDSAISYVDAQSTITATVSPNATEGRTEFYYRLCSKIQLGNGDLVECMSNGSTMVSKHRWRKSGLATLVVHVYTDSNYSEFLDCDFTQVTVAGECGQPLAGTKITKVTTYPHTFFWKESLPPLIIEVCSWCHSL